MSNYLIFAPGAFGDNPLLALANELNRLLPASITKPQIELATKLAKEPLQLSELVARLLEGKAIDAMLFLFIDQFEELFTLTADPHRTAFIELLVEATNHPRIRVVTALRADFLPLCAAEPRLAAMFEIGTFVLGPPGYAAFADIIRRPAERAGLDMENGLADEILRDVGSDLAEALPLVAFCLEELHRRTAPNSHFTIVEYRALGRLGGAIGQRAGSILSQLRQTEGEGLDAALSKVFESVIQVSASGKPARQRALLHELMAAPKPIPKSPSGNLTNR